MQKKLLAVLGISVFCGFVLLTQPGIVRAQSAPIAPLSIEISPQYPAPYQTIHVSIKSSVFDISNSTFTVSVNGKKIGSGTGAQSVSFTANGPGVPLAISVAVKSSTGVYTKTVRLRPASVALVTEPLATAPTLYPGKPTIPSTGSIRVVAVPDFREHNSTINPAKLSYTWHIGNRTFPSKSGVGRSTFVMPAPNLYGTQNVSVLVQSPDNALVASQEITITPHDPVVRIYKDDPLMGVEYSHALTGSQDIAGTEATFVAAAYGFPNNNGAPLFQWYLNGQSAQTGNSITLQPKGSGKGSETLSVTAQSADQNQTASGALTLLFGSAPSGFGLFGL